MAQHNELGKLGEKAAMEYLRQQGYTIVEHNWFYEKYEIDIIARNDEWIVFVEVKTRASDQWGNPEESVSKAKIKRIVEAADFYLNEYDIDLPTRFDIISIIMKGQSVEIDHIEDAFLAPIN